jgi:hypothetical protein
MSANTSPEANRKTVETVQKLLSLAQDEATTEEEARNAALRAVRLMKENSLTVISGNPGELEETLRGAKEAIETARKEAHVAKQGAQQKLILGAVAGFLISKHL